jgi:DNA processing protein
LPSNDTAILLALSRAPGLNRATVEALARAFDPLQAALHASTAELLDVPGMTPEAIEGFRDMDLAWAKRELQAICRLGASLLTWRDPGYPENLLNACDRPPILYVLGHLEPADAAAVAIVGSTDPSPGGRRLAYRLGWGLAHAGLTVVSGLALGIDTAAHSGALSAHRRTLAVLGGGLRRIFPPENKALAARIARVGALLSELPLDTPAGSQGLVARNRITSGLAMATIVVESRNDSGSLYTAARARKQGRLVLAVDNGTEGNSSLLADGAQAIAAQGPVDYDALARTILTFVPATPRPGDTQLSLDF